MIRQEVFHFETCTSGVCEQRKVTNKKKLEEDLK